MQDKIIIIIIIIIIKEILINTEIIIKILTQDIRTLTKKSSLGIWNKTRNEFTFLMTTPL